MLIKKSQAILTCLIDFKSGGWFTLGSEDETMFCDTWNFFQLNCRSRFSKHLMTGSPVKVENSSPPPTVGQLSANSRSTDGQLSAVCRPTGFSTVVTICRPTVGRLLVGGGELFFTFTGSPILSVNFTNRKNPAKPKCHMSIKNVKQNLLRI